jgi:serine/threonine protein kinase
VFGETWMAFWSGDVGRRVTVKKLSDLDFSTAALEALRNETKKLMYEVNSIVAYNELIRFRYLKHPNVAPVIGSGVKDAKYIMAEYIEGVSAYAYLRNPSIPIGSPLILSLARQTAAGLFYLHEQGIIHGSFKSKNVMIDRDNIVHVKDYGYLDSKDVIDRLDAQPQYLAPEVITGSAYTEKIDIYSYGMFLWELFTKQTPFMGLTPNQIIDEIIYRQLRPEIPSTCPIVFEKLIRSCWSADPKYVPAFSTVS